MTSLNNIDKTKAVLIVDDFSSMRRLYKVFLERLGFTKIIEASSGEEALTKLNEQTCSIIISDMYMPTLPGLELLKNIRSQTRYKNVPFVLVSDGIGKEILPKHLEDENTSFMVKPISVIALKNKLEGICQ